MQQVQKIDSGFKVKLSEFIPSLTGDITVEGFQKQPTNPLIPIKKNHHFEQDFLRDILNFLFSPSGDALYISGPTGSGKTSGVLQTAARLFWPVQQFTCHGQMELSDLIGRFKLVAGKDGAAPSMQFAYGPLPIAMQYGHILLLNELDYAEPSEIAGLNDVLEGRPLNIPETNSIIQPHPNFRVIATGNSVGSGDPSGRYLGVMAQNMAFMDRFRLLIAGYLPENIEVGLLKSEFQWQDKPNGPIEGLPDEIIESAVKVANAIRKAYTGDERVSGTLSVTMSTRTLIRWLNLSLDVQQSRGGSAFGDEANPMAYGLRRALTNRVDQSEKVSIHQIAKSIFGGEWE